MTVCLLYTHAHVECMERNPAYFGWRWPSHQHNEMRNKLKKKKKKKQRMAAGSFFLFSPFRRFNQLPFSSNHLEWNKRRGCLFFGPRNGGGGANHQRVRSLGLWPTALPVSRSQSREMCCRADVLLSFS